MSLPPPPPGPPPSVTSANTRPPGPPPSLLASIQQKGSATSPPPPPPPSGSQGNTPNAGKGGFNTNLLQRAANSNDNNKDNSDSDWSEDESVHTPTPAVTNNITIKSAVSKPPVHSKPPPARPNSGYVAPPAPQSNTTTTTSAAKSFPPPPGINTQNAMKITSNNSVPPPPLQIKVPPPPIVSNNQQIDLSVAASPGPPGPPKRQSIKIQDNSEELTNLKSEVNGLMAQLLDKDDVISSLQEDLVDSKRKLADADGKLAAALVKKTTDNRSAVAIAASSSANTREAELGRELDSAYNRINELKGEKMQLEASIKALTVRLTLTESKLEATSQKQINSVLNFESTFKKSDRETTLETQLVKAKRDKDKAVRLVILLIGKEKVAEFLKKHAGAPDILDKLIESYGSGKFNDGGSLAPQTQRNMATSFPFDTRFKESIANDVLKYGY